MISISAKYMISTGKLKFYNIIYFSKRAQEIHLKHLNKIMGDH
jgi:hypothetical protein